MRLPITYNIRNLLVRKLSAGLTLAIVAAVVLVLAVLLSYTAGIRESLKASGSDRNILVLKPGSTAESTSIIRQFEAAKVIQAPGIDRSAGGELLVSQELCVQTNVPRRADGRPANVAVRGVDPVAFDVRPELHVIEGRPFEFGALECIVGASARQHFSGLQIGDELRMGRTLSRVFRVVGVFEAGGSALESEILAPRSMVNDVFLRFYTSSLLVRLTDAAAAKGAIEYLNGPAVALEAKTERAYFAGLASRMNEIVLITSGLATIMGIGAAFAVANTMFAAVDSRRREIAMLRTIGFPRSAIVVSFVLEALLICGCGAVLGLLCSLVFDGLRQDFLSDTSWTVMAFQMRVTPSVVAVSLGTALVVGLLGALAPALRASRIRIIDALRNA